jgi:hypothetical protein
MLFFQKQSLPLWGFFMVCKKGNKYKTHKQDSERTE